MMSDENDRSSETDVDRDLDQVTGPREEGLEFANENQTADPLTKDLEIQSQQLDEKSKVEKEFETAIEKVQEINQPTSGSSDFPDVEELQENQSPQDRENFPDQQLDNDFNVHIDQNVETIEDQYTDHSKDHEEIVKPEQKTESNEDSENSPIAQETGFYSEIETNHLFGNVNQVIFQETKKKGEEEGKEPLVSRHIIPLTKVPTSLPDSLSDEILHQQQRWLLNRQVAVLGCTDERFAYDVAKALAFKFDKTKFDLLQLFVGRDETTSTFSIDIFLREKIGNGSDAVVLVDIKSPTFFASVISMKYGISETLKEELKKKRIFLILSISSELWLKDIKEKGPEFYFDFWEIPTILKSEVSDEKTKELEELVSDKEGVEKILLYVVTFFSGLNQEDFEEIMLILLGAVKKKKKKAKLKDEWLERPDFFLNQCGAAKVYSETLDSEIIDFSGSHARVILKQHFNSSHSFYTRQKFEVLLESGLLFSLTTNAQIVNNLIDLILKKLAGSSVDFNVTYLHKITRKIVDPSVLRTDSDISMQEFWSRLGQLQILNVIRRNSINILAQILDEMLSNSRLQDAVKRYLDICMYNSRELVQELTEQLRYSPNFDKFYWIRRLLNEGDVKTRDKSYHFLVKLSKQIGIRIYEFLTVIRTWLPSSDTHFDHFSPANVYGLNFIIDYTHEITHRFSTDHFGLFPSKYALFATLDGKKDLLEESLEIIVSWLFHPAIVKARLFLLKQELTEKKLSESQVKREILVFQANVIEVWYAILTWRLEEAEETEAETLKSIAACLITQVCENSTRITQQKLSKIWEARAIHYTETSNKLLRDISSLKIRDSQYRMQLLSNRKFFMKSFHVLSRLRKAFKKNTVSKNLNL